MSQMKKRIHKILRHYVFLSRLHVNRQQDEINLISHHPALQMTVKRYERSVIFLRIRRPLLEIKRKQREPPPISLRLRRASRKTEQLNQVPPILLAEPVIG